MVPGGGKAGIGEAIGAGEFRADLDQEGAAALDVGGDVGEVFGWQQAGGIEFVEDDQVEFVDVGFEKLLDGKWDEGDGFGRGVEGFRRGAQDGEMDEFDRGV
jgi:hypothetical protein